MKHYYSERWNFSIAYPDNWETMWENKPVDPWVIAVAFASEEGVGDRAGFIVNVRRGEALVRYLKYIVGPEGKMVKAPMTPQEFIQAGREETARRFSNFRFHTGEETKLLGKPAARTVYSYDARTGRTKEQCITLFGVGVTFQFICEAPEAEFERWKPTFDHILHSFRIGKGEGAAPPTAADVEKMSPVEVYNTGVVLYREGQYEKAKECFRRCYQSGSHPLQAAYAALLCDSQLGRRPVIPEELKGREDETGVVYVASNLACYLMKEGHRAVLKKTGEESEVRAYIDDTQYSIRTSSSLLGGFRHFAYRQEGTESTMIHPLPKVPLTETDRYLISLIKNASSLPLSPLPKEGLDRSIVF